MIQFLEELRKAKHPEKEKKQQKERRPILKNYYNLDIKAYVVFLRYGSLTEPGPKWHTFKRIGEIAGMKTITAFKIVKTWKANGYKIINRRLG